MTATCSYLGVLEESRDASDVQTEASRGASCSVNTASEERVVLLPRAHTSRAQQRRNPQTQAHTHAQAPGKHAPAAVYLIPPRIGQYCVRAPPEKLKKLQLYTGEEPRAEAPSDWSIPL